MRSIALLLVFVAGRILMLAGRDLEWNGWAPIAFLWQDVLMVVVFAMIDRLAQNSRLSWVIYAALVVYLAINVPLVRVLSTPLTPALVRAASGPLFDSIEHHLNVQAAFVFAATLTLGVVIPLLLMRCRRQLPGTAWLALIAGAFMTVLLGPAAAVRTETHGLERNVVFTYLFAMNGRVDNQIRSVDWREPLGAYGEGRDWHALRGAVRGRNIVLIALESTGAKYLRTWGAVDDPTPALTALAKDALIFQNAYAVYPESVKGLFSVLCSRYPAFDTQAEEYEGLPVTSLPEALGRSGYHTALFHSGHFEYLGMEEMLRGRGFHEMRDAGDIGGRSESSFGISEVQTVLEILRWVDQLPDGQPFFLSYVPVAGHHPYMHPGQGPFDGSTEINRYRNALHYGDSALENLLDGLKERGQYDKTCFVLYGDHGEAFGEHEGNYGHTLFIYEENVHVPLLIVAPGVIQGSHHVQAMASVIDIAPTICDLLGIKIPVDFQGSSLLLGVERMALFYTDYSLGLLGLREGPWKFIYELETGRARLYDLVTDPGEKRNMSQNIPILAHAYEERVRQWAQSQRGQFESLKAGDEARGWDSLIAVQPCSW